MWDNRFNDLWLYPMPDWFVAVCNQFGGTRVLDGMFIAELIGVACLLVGWFADLLAVTVVGWVLIAPAVLLVLLMIATAQYHERFAPREEPTAEKGKGPALPPAPSSPASETTAESPSSP